MAVLITGGAGYIGSHTVAEFLAQGEEVVVLDHLEKGHAEAVRTEQFYQGDIRDHQLFRRIVKQHDIEAIIHFAADSLVGESVKEPLKYYENNVNATKELLLQMNAYGINKIVFSSTAAVYGEPMNEVIKETDRTYPTNPYGETKLAIEKMLKWCDEAYGIKSIALRYFNAAGAHPDGRIGEDHSPETHLIPLILQVPLKQRDAITVFGDNYPTNDGTCIRDYIHVMDLAYAHRLALQSLRKNEESQIYNLGNGTGFSVKEVIDVARTITGHKIKEIVGPRRMGDPAKLVASSAKAQQELGWERRYPNLELIMESAWNWHKNHPFGYK